MDYLSKLVSLKGRFHRSAHLARDWKNQTELENYLLTPTAKQVALRLIAGSNSSKEEHVWTITGPYGTGKTSFLLFITDLFSNISPINSAASDLRNKFLNDKKTYIPVLCVGYRGSLKAALLLTLYETIRTTIPVLAEEINETLRLERIDDFTIVNYFQKAIDIIQENELKGILLIVDEFGKFLEFASQHSETEDIFILQELAEMASRANGSFLFITVLHSAIDGYLPAFDEIRKIEWKKIQGRFVDIPFIEPPEQFLSLIGKAINWNTDNLPIVEKYQEKILNMIQTIAFTESAIRYPLGELLPPTIPFNPCTALLLWPLFRSKLSQNERSLFSFLMDNGPFGFQEFLSISSIDINNPQLYRLDFLYDYVTNTLGSSVLLGEQSKRWAEIEHAIERIPANAPLLSKPIVKIIGLLNLYGASVGLSASLETIKIAIDDDSIFNVIDYLEKSSIIIFRQFIKAYALWEGSDVDLDSVYKDALGYIGHEDLPNRLKKVIRLRPFVARAHYIQKGTLRFFNVDIINGEKSSILHAINEDIKGADGKIIFVLSHDEKEQSMNIEITKELTKTQDNSRLIFAFPKPMSGLEQILEEVETWSWIKMNVQALDSDPVARKEVDTRVLSAIRGLTDRAGEILGIRGYAFNPSTSFWIHSGEEKELSSAIEFQKWLSKLCDDIYYWAPELHNELINREYLSAASTGARRNLIQAMVDSENLESLGINGTPAEMSMYRSMLLSGGFHTKLENGWKFVSPNSSWRHVWNVMNEFLDGAKENRKNLSELINILKTPPFGVRDGSVYVLIVCLILVQREYIALYEDGYFVTDLRIEVFERLTRRPETFEIQLFQLSGKTREAVNAIGQLLQVLDLNLIQDNESQLVDVVKPLITFVSQLPDYSKKTRRLELSEAIRVREVLLKTSDPYKLLFSDLPKIFDTTLERDEDISRFIVGLKNCILSLQSAYPSLLDEIESQIKNVFNLTGTSVDIKRQLQERAEPLVEWVVDRSVVPFVKSAANLDNERDWREVLARAVLQGRPPFTWLDSEVTKFQILLRQLASEFVRVEELVAEQNRNSPSTILRIGILNGSIREKRMIITNSDNNTQNVNSLITKIKMVIENEATINQQSKVTCLTALAQLIDNYLDEDS